MTHDYMLLINFLDAHGNLSSSADEAKLPT